MNIQKHTMHMKKNSMHIQRQQNLPQKARLITRKQKDGQISLKDMPMKQMITKKAAKESYQSANDYKTITTYYCSDLSVSPDNFNMTAEETEASFDLTIDLTTESEINTTASEDTAFSFKNFMAAVLNLDLFGRTPSTETTGAILNNRSGSLSPTSTFLNITENLSIIDTGSNSYEPWTATLKLKSTKSSSETESRPVLKH